MCLILFGTALADPPPIPVPELRPFTAYEDNFPPIQELAINLKANICPTLPSWMANTDRIIAGQNAQSPIPWQVSLRMCPHGWCHKCGGTVLDSKTILTGENIKPFLALISLLS